MICVEKTKLPGGLKFGDEVIVFHVLTSLCSCNALCWSYSDISHLSGFLVTAAKLSGSKTNLLCDRDVTANWASDLEAVAVFI